MNNSIDENESFIEARLANQNKAEVRSWLENTHTDEYFVNLGELGSNEESLDLVDKFYDAGAVEVIAVEIDKYEEGENTGKLVIVLPEDTEKRAKVLGLCSEIAEGQGFDRVEDFGQKRVFLMLD